MGEGQILAEAPARFKPDAGVILAAGQNGFQLRIMLEAFRHVAHRRTRRLVTGHVPGLILVLAGMVELLPTFHEAVGAAARIDAQFGLELERADGPAGLAAGASRASSGFFL